MKDGVKAAAEFQKILDHRGLRVSSENGFKNDGGSFTAKGKLAGGHFVENHAKRKKIGAAIQFLATRLLRRHVGDGAERSPWASELVGVHADGGHGVDGILRLCGSGNFGQAEVKNLGVAARGDEEVRGLDVAVNDIFSVSGVQAVGDFNRQVQEAFRLHGLRVDDVLERAAIEEFHDDEAFAFVLSDFINGADVRMIEIRSGAGFSAEAFKSKRIAGSDHRGEI